MPWTCLLLIRKGIQACTFKGSTTALGQSAVRRHTRAVVVIIVVVVRFCCTYGVLVRMKFGLQSIYCMRQSCGHRNSGINSGFHIVASSRIATLSSLVVSQEVTVWVASCGIIPCPLLLTLGLYAGAYNMQLHILKLVYVLLGCSSETHLDQGCFVHVVDIV